MEMIVAGYVKVRDRRALTDLLAHRRKVLGEGPGRTAHVLDAAKLPEAKGGFQWSVVSDFGIGDAILADPGLKSVFEQALRQGRAVVARGS